MPVSPSPASSSPDPTASRRPPLAGPSRGWDPEPPARPGAGRAREWAGLRAVGGAGAAEGTGRGRRAGGRLTWRPAPGAAAAGAAARPTSPGRCAPGPRGGPGRGGHSGCAPGWSGRTGGRASARRRFEPAQLVRGGAGRVRSAGRGGCGRAGRGGAGEDAPGSRRGCSGLGTARGETASRAALRDEPAEASPRPPQPREGRSGGRGGGSPGRQRAAPPGSPVAEAVPPAWPRG